VSASVNLPLHIKSRSSLLAPAHLDGPGKRVVNGCGVCYLLTGIVDYLRSNGELKIDLYDLYTYIYQIADIYQRYILCQSYSLAPN